MNPHTYFTKNNCRLDNPFITMGTFDGVHLGHQKLIRELVNLAKAAGHQSVVITYYHHPLETIFRNTFPYLLTEIKTREKLITDLGIDCILYLNFTKSLAEMSPDDFLKKVIFDELKPRKIVVGYDTNFGKNRAGDFDFLKHHENIYCYKVDCVEPFRLNGKIVSSSWCRECVRAGAVEMLKNLLGRSYSISGTVTPGNRIGHKLGFPTVNILWHDPNKLLPKNGIYLSKVFFADKQLWGVTNIGFRPTVIDKSDLTLETHILDFDQEIYGQYITITFEIRLRSEFKLRDKEELIDYINNDIHTARKIISERV